MNSKTILLALLLIVLIFTGAAAGMIGFFFVGVAVYDIFFGSTYKGWEGLGTFIVVLGTSALLGVILGGIGGNKLGKFILIKRQINLDQISARDRIVAFLSLVAIGVIIYSVYEILGLR